MHRMGLRQDTLEWESQANCFKQFCKQFCMLQLALFVSMDNILRSTL